MAQSKKELFEILEADSRNYRSQNISWHRKVYYNLFSNPISEQKYIWLYIKAMRYVEYYSKVEKSFYGKLLLLYWLRKLRSYSHITSFQIPPPYMW